MTMIPSTNILVLFYGMVQAGTGEWRNGALRRRLEQRSNFVDTLFLCLCFFSSHIAYIPNTRVRHIADLISSLLFLSRVFSITVSLKIARRWIEEHGAERSAACERSRQSGGYLMSLIHPDGVDRVGFNY